MFPFIHLGPVTLGTFGLMLWLAAVCATLTLHFNLQRNGLTSVDALNIVAFVTIAGVIGAKAWHELQDVQTLKLALHEIAAPGIHRPLDLLIGDSTKAREKLGWKPEVGFEELVRMMVDADLAALG